MSRDCCQDTDNGYMCTLALGHKEFHTAHGGKGTVVHSWRLEACRCAFPPPTGQHNASCPHSVVPGDVESVLAYLES